MNHGFPLHKVKQSGYAYDASRTYQPNLARPSDPQRWMPTQIDQGVPVRTRQAARCAGGGGAATSYSSMHSTATALARARVQ
jgi:hypothetical protein